ncbi:MAG: TonB-dependent receptor family protein [Bacteroidales bacterium]|jgi:hypothetical protein|nr:TonB-dependent receptor family protein [Bacteroidales bacterium]
MKKYIILITVLSLSSTSLIFAQRYTIKGNIIDASTKQTMPFVNCVLYKVNDTINIFKGTSSDTNGNFLFSRIKNQNLILQLSSVGYDKLRLDIKKAMFNNEALIIDLGTLEMQSNGLLESVEITAKVDRIQVDEDKMTVNIDDQLAQSVTSAFDLLKKVPGVFIDKDDNITLNGQSGVVFQYNGRELKLDWEAIADMLKGMTPDQVEKFEIITNPGVKYDADGKAGIINIRLKKNQNYGINGSLSGRGSYQTVLTYGGNLRLNYVDNRWTTSFGVGVNQWANKSDGTSKRYQTMNNGDTMLFSSKNTNNWATRYTNINLSANYMIDTTQTIGLWLYYNYGDTPYRENYTPTLISKYPYYDEIDSSYLNFTGYKRFNNNFSFGLDYVKQFDTLGRKLSAEVDFSLSKRDGNNVSKNDYYIGEIYNNGQIIRNDAYDVSTLSDANNLSARADYIKPFNKTSKLETGIRTKLSFSDVDYSALILDSNNNFINDASKTNRFKYFENINSFYASFSRSFFKKANLRLGLRLEQTNTKGRQFVYDSVNQSSYFNLFPNIRLSYSFKPDNRLTLSYSYRISRPWSSYLNPFIQKSDEYSYSTGNPALNPEYSQSISLSHSWKYMLFTNIYYTYNTDEIENLSYMINDSSGKYNYLAMMSSPVNFGSSHSLYISVNFYKQLFSWWSLGAYLGGRYNKVSSSLNQTNLNRSLLSYNINVSTDFSLPKKWRLSAYYYFSSGSLSGLSKSNSYQNLSLSVSKSFFKDVLSCGFSLSNLLNIGASYYEYAYTNTITKSWGAYQGPQVSLNIRYKFGKYYQNKQVKKPQLESFDDRAGEEK